MNKIKTGDLLVRTRPISPGISKFISQTVRFFSTSIYTHVGIILREGDNLYVIESIYPKIQKIELCNVEDFFIVETNLSEKVNEKEVNLLLNEVGKKLSVGHSLFSLLNILRGKKYWSCTRLTNYFYKDIMKLKIKETYVPIELVTELLSINVNNTQRFIKKGHCNDNN